MDIARQFLDYAKLHVGEMAWRLVAALTIMVIAWLCVRIARAALRRVFERGVASSARMQTILPLLRALASIAIMGAGVVLSLEQLGFDLTAVIAGAGVVGLAVAFGSQELVRDLISGFFLILDGVIEAGDSVEIEGISGTVEGVGLRKTMVRGFDGKLWFVPNGQIKVVGNASREWMRAVVMVGLAYEQDARRGMDLLAEVGREWCAANPEIVLDEPTVQGLLGLDASSVGVRLFVKVKPGEQGSAERELRQRIKEAFAREGIEIPCDRQVLYMRKEPAA